MEMIVEDHRTSRSTRRKFFCPGQATRPAGNRVGDEATHHASREREARMSGQQFSRNWLAGALGLALAFGVGGYAVARAKDAVSTTRVHASLKLADPSEGPSK